MVIAEESICSWSVRSVFCSTESLPLVLFDVKECQVMHLSGIAHILFDSSLPINMGSASTYSRLSSSSFPFKFQNVKSGSIPSLLPIPLTRLSIGRRYFRFFKFLDCFSKAYDAFYSGSGLGGVLLVGKWSCMGGYLILESSTIVSSRAWVWGKVLMREECSWMLWVFGRRRWRSR